MGARLVVEPADAARGPAGFQGCPLTRVLKQHRIRRIDAATLRERLRVSSVKLAPGTVEAATTRVRLLVERLAPLNRQLPHAAQQLDRLVRKLAGAAPVVGPSTSAADDQASPAETPDAAALLSPPGIRHAGAGHAARRGQRCGATALLSRASLPVRGVPVTKRSGKSLVVERRLTAYGRLPDADFHWTRVPVQLAPVSHGKYRASRARGHSHGRAPRSVADRLQNVACAMLRDGAPLTRTSPSHGHLNVIVGESNGPCHSGGTRHRLTAGRHPGSASAAP